MIQQSNICTYIYIYYTHIMYYIHIFNEHTTVIHSRVPILQHETARHMTSSSKPLACGETMLMRQEAVMPAWLKLKVQSCGVQQGPAIFLTTSEEHYIFACGLCKFHDNALQTASSDKPLKQKRKGRHLKHMLLTAANHHQLRRWQL